MAGNNAAPCASVTPYWQFSRAAAVTALVTGIPAAAHVAAGGQLPTTGLMVLLAALIMAPVTALSRRRLSLPMLSGILGAGQVFLHAAFNALAQPETRCAPAEATGHSHRQGLAVPDCMTAIPPALTETTASGHWAMSAAHLVATALTVLILARAEAALWQLRDWLRPLIQPPHPPRLPHAMTVIVPEPASRPRRMPCVRVTAPRGPPSPTLIRPS